MKFHLPLISNHRRPRLPIDSPPARLPATANGVRYSKSKYLTPSLRIHCGARGGGSKNSNQAGVKFSIPGFNFILSRLSSRRITAGFFILFSAAALAGVGCIPNSNETPTSDVTLVMWGLWEESGQLSSAIAAFQEQTGVKIAYKKIASVANYESELLAAIAENRGPDIYVIHHSWVAGKRALMTPAPSSIIDERALREEFVDVVAEDLIYNGQIYALPTSVDTLALYYNKDILSSAGVARPPATWEEFQQVVERITRINRFGNIEQSAAALGTARNISRASDIIQLLFMQSGVPIATKQDTSVTIGEDRGLRSLLFYTDYANKSKQVYTWDLQQDYSIDAFAEGDTAMMFHYSYQIDTIKAKNPRLRFGIAPMPQIKDSKVVNFAAYWPFAVSNRSRNPDLSWQFLRLLTSNDQSQMINQLQQIPPARREGVIAFQRDPVLGVFAEQSLTAGTWPRGDIVSVDAIINNMIDDIVTGATVPTEALRRASDQLNQIRPPADIPAAPAQAPGDAAPPQPDIGFF